MTAEFSYCRTGRVRAYDSGKTFITKIKLQKIKNVSIRKFKKKRYISKRMLKRQIIHFMICKCELTERARINKKGKLVLYKYNFIEL